MRHTVDFDEMMKALMVQSSNNKKEMSIGSSKHEQESKQDSGFEGIEIRSFFKRKG